MLSYFKWCIKDSLVLLFFKGLCKCSYILWKARISLADDTMLWAWEIVDLILYTTMLQLAHERESEDYW
jgi:hypothetical protein